MKKHFIYTSTMLLLSVAISVMLVYAAYTETHYVCRDGHGAGLEDGTSEANCWDGFDAIQWDTDDADDNKVGPNDVLYLCEDETYYETLTVGSSGTSGNVITITHEVGESPKISMGEEISAWTVHNPGTNNDIYKASTTTMNPWGVACGSPLVLLPKHMYGDSFCDCDYDRPASSNSNPSVSDLDDNMLDEHSWFPQDENMVYIHSSDGAPGTCVVGVRVRGIHLDGKDYITIDGIDVDGPGGRDAAYEGSGYHSYYNGDGYAAIDLEDSNYNTIQNLTIRNTVAAAIRLDNNSDNNTVDNVTISWARNGVSGYDSDYNTVKNCTMTNIGAQLGSFGDRGMVSSWGNHWTVEYNHFENHGWADQRTLMGTYEQIMDRAVTFCCGELRNPEEETAYNIVRFNYFKNIGSGAIYFNDGGYNEAYGNVINGWNLSPPNTTQDRGHCISSKPDGSDYHENVKIYNNTVTNGVRNHIEDGDEVAFRFCGYHKNSEIKNNIATGNEAGMLAIRVMGNDASTGNVIAQNIFECPSGNCGRRDTDTPTYWAYNKMEGNEEGEFQYDINATDEFSSVTGTDETAATFADEGNEDFSLQVGSSGINDGVDVGNGTERYGWKAGTGKPGAGLTLTLIDRDQTQWDMGAYVADTTAPTSQSFGPDGNLSYATTKEIYHNTDESCTCKYDTSDKAYGDMANTMDGSGTGHTKTIDVSEGENNIYSRCQDPAGNTQDSSAHIQFWVQSGSQPTNPSPDGISVGVSGNYDTQ